MGREENDINLYFVRVVRVVWCARVCFVRATAFSEFVLRLIAVFSHFQFFFSCDGGNIIHVESNTRNTRSTHRMLAPGRRWCESDIFRKIPGASWITSRVPSSTPVVFLAKMYECARTNIWHEPFCDSVNYCPFVGTPPIFL